MSKATRLNVYNCAKRLKEAAARPGGLGGDAARALSRIWIEALVEHQIAVYEESLAAGGEE